MKLFVIAILVGLSCPLYGATLLSEDWSSDTIGFGKTSLINWTVLGGTNVDIDTLCGTRCIDMDGSFGNSLGDIQSKTTFSLIPGETYTLTMFVGTGSLSNNALRIRIAGFDEIVNGPTAFSSFTLTRTFTVLNATSSPLRLTEVGPADNGGVLLDNIVLSSTSSSVPEPTSIVLMATGVLALLSYRQRK